MKEAVRRLGKHRCDSIVLGTMGVFRWLMVAGFGRRTRVILATEFTVSGPLKGA